MVTIGDKIYAFDVDEIFKFITRSDTGEAKETEIVNNYEVDSKQIPALLSKSIRELTTPGSPQIDNIKYDFIKTLIVELITLDDANLRIDEIDEVPFGTKLVVNTLIRKGFLIEISE
mgnify:CR=1 FL=1